MTADFIIRCRKTGLYFCDVHVNALVISNARHEAMPFPDEDAAQRVIDCTIKPPYSSFDWCAVPREPLKAH